MRESCFYSNTYNTTHYYCVYTGIFVVRMYISNLSLKTQLRAVGLMSGFFVVNAVHCFSQQRELTLGALLCSPCPDALCCRAVCVSGHEYITFVFTAYTDVAFVSPAASLLCCCHSQFGFCSLLFKNVPARHCLKDESCVLQLTHSKPSTA